MRTVGSRVDREPSPPTPRPQPVAPAVIVAVAVLIVTAWAMVEARSILLVGGALVGGSVLLYFVLRRYEMFVMTVLACRASLDVFKAGDRTQHGIDPAVLLAGLLIVAGAVWLSLDRRALRESRSPLRLPMIALVVCGAFSILGAVRPVDSAVELMRIIAVLVMVMSLERIVTTPTALRRMMAALLIACVVPIAVGLGQAVTGTGEVTLGGFARLTGTFVHPNPFAFFLALFIVMGVAIVPHVTGTVRGLVLAAIGLGGVCLVLTYTRTAWIALGVGIVVVAIFQSRRLLIALCVVAGLVVLLFPSVSARFSDLSESTSRSGAVSNSLAWRTSYWGQTLKLVDNPGMGIGLKMVSETVEEQKAPHNDFVRVFVEMGVLGLAAYCWLLVAIIRVASGALRATTDGLARGIAVGFAGCVATFLVISVVSNLISQVVVIMYFFAFAMAAVAVTRLGRAELRSV